jgi:DNA-binding CsgD family transcriptional regulator
MTGTLWALPAQAQGGGAYQASRAPGGPLRDLHHPPSSLTAALAQATAVRGDVAGLRRVLERSPVPMLTFDGDRRYRRVNRPARLLFRKTLDEMLKLRVDDLTPANSHDLLRARFERLTSTGSVGGDYEVAFEDGTRLDVVFWAVADLVPGEHLAVFAPAGWPDGELSRTDGDNRGPELTRRELEVLRLAAEGNSARRIAELLVVSESTIKAHLSHAYAKLRAPDRAAAVARAIRLGLID